MYQGCYRHLVCRWGYWLVIANQVAGLFGGGVPPAAVGDYESIASVSGSGASSITFSSIPSTYKHLQIRFIAQNSHPSYTTQFDMQLNGATGSVYSWHKLYGNGSSVNGSGGSTQTYIQFGDILVPGGSSQQIMCAGVIDILDYADTNKYKTMRFLGGVDTNGGGSILLSSGSYQATTAVSSFTFKSENGTYSFGSNSRFALYGVK